MRQMARHSSFQSSLYISAYGFYGSLLLRFAPMYLEPPVLLGRGLHFPKQEKLEPMMLTTEKKQQILDFAAGIVAEPINKLVSNPNWGTINFEAARGDLELLFSLCSHIKQLPIEILPDATANTFITSLTQAGKTVESIRNFNIENGNPTGTRDQIIGQVKTHAEHLLTTTQGWIPFLAYQKGDVQKNIDSLNKAILDANKILESSKAEVKTKSDEISTIDTAAREASASAGVGVFTSDFDGEATTLGKEAEKWLKYTLWFAITTLVVAYFSIYIPIDKDATNAQIFQHMTSKLVVLLVLLTATVWCGRIYKALKHQITVNRHRANSLKTFQAFVKAASDDATRNAVLLETTRSIFTNSPSGYLEGSDSASDTNTKVLEIVKGASHVQRAG